MSSVIKILNKKIKSPLQSLTKQTSLDLMDQGKCISTSLETHKSNIIKISHWSHCIKRSVVIVSISLSTNRQNGMNKLSLTFLI